MIDCIYSQLYLFAEEWTPKAIRATVEMRGTSEDPLVRHAEGTKALDLVGTTWVGVYLISQRLKDVLEGAGFTGWTSTRIQVSGKRATALQNYSLLHFLGRAGPVQDQRSRPFVLPPYRPGLSPRTMHRGLYLEGDWHEDVDFMSPEDTWFRIVTQRVHDEVRRAKLTNVSLVNLEKVERTLLRSKDTHIVPQLH